MKNGPVTTGPFYELVYGNHPNPLWYLIPKLLPVPGMKVMGGDTTHSRNGYSN